MPTLEQWRGLWERLGADVPGEAAFEALLASYRQPHRRYHTLQHLDECLDHVGMIREVAPHPAEVELALWFHDVVFELGAADNEQRSADLALRSATAAGLPAACGERVHALILATARNAAVEDADAAVLVDVDLVSLASAPARFAECEIQLREEMPWLTDLQYRDHRRRSLGLLLARARLFRTAAFHDRFEAVARSRLASTLERL